MRTQHRKRLIAALLMTALFAGCGGGQTDSSSPDPTPTPTPTPTPPPVPGSLSLSAAAYAVSQSAGSLSVTVVRSGGSDGTLAASYTSSDGSAAAGRDYTAVSGSLNWPAGDATAKTFSVLISNAAPFNGTRSFNVSITGAAVATPTSATVTITGSSATMGAAAASRLLTQATFGPTMNDISTAAAQSYDAWFAAQTSATPSLTYPYIQNATDNPNWLYGWWRNSVQGPDQLRQRMAFALSEILVISQQAGALNSRNKELAYYYDLLNKGALGSYRDLMQQVTLSLQMGVFLSMYHSSKADPTTGIHADQNFAREVMQLFTVGLVQLNQDGTPKLDANGAQIPTYGFAEVLNMANALTGWASNPTAHTGEAAYMYDYDFFDPMTGYENHHDTTAKTIIGGVQIPAGGTTASDLKIALDTLFNHPNTAPFVSKQLIQRLVTSNPSPAYVQRVATVFANDGSGTRGNLLAVAKAILTDPEAEIAGGNSSGKLREPLLRFTSLWRAFSGTDGSGTASEYTVVQNSSDLFGEAPLNAATVFNFFQPDYVRAGALASAGLVAPEFQITNENTAVQTSNQLLNEAYQFVDSSGQTHAGYQGYDQSQSLSTTQSVLLHTAQWEPLADNPGGLIDMMNQVLMEGVMPAAMRTTLVNYITAIPTTEASYRAERVVEAADLVINSPQFAIQR